MALELVVDDCLKSTIATQWQENTSPVASRIACFAGWYNSLGMVNTDWRTDQHRAGRHHGDPVITGTRVPVGMIIGSIADGDTAETILKSYFQLTPKDVNAAQPRRPATFISFHFPLDIEPCRSA